MEKIPVALQLYSIRQECAADLPGCLSAVATMGYAGVEFAGYYGHSAAELRGMLDGLGLQVAGTHSALSTLEGTALDATIEFNQVLGNSYLIVPGLPPERRATPAAWRETARRFDEIGERLRPHGMRVGYHNHTHEFLPLEGELPWDIFAHHTHEHVILQLDIGHARRAGSDPVEVLARYPDRGVTVHVKDYAPDNERALLGEGDIRWDEVFRICESSAGTRWYIVEQETYPHPPLESVRRCREWLKRAGR